MQVIEVLGPRKTVDETESPIAPTIKITHRPGWAALSMGRERFLTTQPRKIRLTLIDMQFRRITIIPTEEFAGTCVHGIENEFPKPVHSGMSHKNFN
jgi:hypothetical protein